MDFAIRGPLAGIRREHLFAVETVPVLAGDPSLRPVRVSASGPSPEGLPQGVLHFSECAGRHNVPVIVGPATNGWIQLPDQVGLTDAAASADQLTSLVQEGMGILSGWLDEQLASEATQVLAEEVEPSSMCVIRASPERAATRGLAGTAQPRAGLHLSAAPCWGE